MKQNLSDRDKKLLFVLLVVAVACLPYVLLIQPMTKKYDSLTNEIRELQSRKSYLEQIALGEETYRSESEAMKVSEQEILSRFPSDLLQEANVLFIDNTEKMIPISLYQVGFGEDVAAQMTSQSTEQAIDAVEAETGDVTQDEVYADSTQTQMLADGLIGVSTTTQFTYNAGYEEWKKFLNYINNYPNRMVITSMTASYTADLDLLNGNFTLKQYALKGEGREPVKYLEPSMIQGSNNIFMEANGIFAQEGEEISDFFLMLNQPESNEDAIIWGQTSDITEETYFTSDENKKQEVSITFTGEDGTYNANYQIGKKSFSKQGVSFTAEDGIDFEVLSSTRAGDDDKVEVILNIVNETDVTVYFAVLNDDEDNPRVTVKGKTGDIFTR